MNRERYTKLFSAYRRTIRDLKERIRSLEAHLILKDTDIRMLRNMVEFRKKK